MTSALGRVSEVWEHVFMRELPAGSGHLTYLHPDTGSFSLQLSTDDQMTEGTFHPRIASPLSLVLQLDQWVAGLLAEHKAKLEPPGWIDDCLPVPFDELPKA